MSEQHDGYEMMPMFHEVQDGAISKSVSSSAKRLFDLYVSGEEVLDKYPGIGFPDGGWVEVQFEVPEVKITTELKENEHRGPAMSFQETGREFVFDCVVHRSATGPVPEKIQISQRTKDEERADLLFRSTRGANNGLTRVEASPEASMVQEELAFSLLDATVVQERRARNLKDT